jgi:methyl-accepting chemotaxis protein
VFTNSTITTTVTVTCLALTLAIGLAFVIARFSIVGPLRALTRAMGELAQGNFDVVLPGLGRKDEVGEIAQAVEDFKVKAAEKARLEADATLRRQKAEAEAEAAAQA